jgi:hypothetical protein
LAAARTSGRSSSARPSAHFRRSSTCSSSTKKHHPPQTRQPKAEPHVISTAARVASEGRGRTLRRPDERFPRIRRAHSSRYASGPSLPSRSFSRGRKCRDVLRR